MKIRSFLTSLILLAIAGLAWAGDLAPKKASDIVVLDATLGFVDPQPPCPAGSRFINTRTLSDDSVEPFSIPEGQVLVITSADFYAEQGVPDRNYEFQIFATGPGGPLVAANGKADASGQVVAAITIPSGVVIKSGVDLCASAGSLAVPNIPSFVRVHGFFAKDK
jgi:hypothetical protein